MNNRPYAYVMQVKGTKNIHITMTWELNKSKPKHFHTKDLIHNTITNAFGDFIMMSIE